MCQHGSDPEPVYSLRYPDPALSASKNCYASAIYDSYNPEVLFGEVLLNPQWTQPTLSQEAVRLNGGVAPPSEPLLPSQFTIQLYNPDQQVIVRYKPKTWNSPASWDFEMPQKTFRQPSSSAIDRTLSDPATSEATPKLAFNWQKDGKLSKDYSCFLSGKTTNPDGSKKKNREPDITIAILQNLKEIILYEPNLYRVEMEDFKGLEVVLILGAVVIRDVYFGQIKEAFNVSNAHRQRASSLPAPIRNKNSLTLAAVPPTQSSGMAPQNAKSPVNAKPDNNTRPPNTKPQRPQVNIPPQNQVTQSARPLADPRSQWEIDAESARLKQKTQADEQERKKREKEQDRKTRKLLEAEEKAARKRQAEVDKETERLKKIYGKEQAQYFSQNEAKPNLPPRPSRQSYSHQPAPPQPHYPHQRSSSTAYPQRQWHGPYLHPPGRQHAPASSLQIAQPRPASSMAMLGPGSPQQVKEKRSFFSFSKPKDDGGKLSKKKSSMF